MTKSFFVRLVLLNTFKKRLRVFLVIGGIAGSSAVMIVLFGVSSGLQHMVSQQAENANTRDVVTVDQRNVQQIRLDQPHISSISSIASVGQVESSVALVGNVVNGSNNLSVPVYGVTKGFFSVTPTDFVSGSGSALKGNNIVVSTKVLQVLGIDLTSAINSHISTSVTTTKDQASQQTADQVTSQAQNYTVVGVVDKGALPIAYMPLDTLRTQGVDTVSQLRVRVTVPGDVAGVRETIEQMGFQTTSIQDTIDQINKVFALIQKVLLLFSIIVFGITVSGTFTIISLTLMEEMKQIGFLRISGLGNRDVHMLFVLQAIVMTTLGALCGIVFGIVGGDFVNGLARAAASNQQNGKVTLFAVPGVQIGLVIVLSVAIGWIVGVMPAKRAIMANPLEELR